MPRRPVSRALHQRTRVVSAMRTSYRNETNALESLLGDLNRCAGERDIDELMRQPQYSVRASRAGVPLG